MRGNQTDKNNSEYAASGGKSEDQGSTAKGKDENLYFGGIPFW